MKGICVRSEIKPLKKVLLHRPGRELLHLTPDRLPELLFDDIPFLKVAQQEHDAFAQILRSNGAEVVYLEDLMAEVLKLHPEQTKPFLYQWLSEGNIKTRRWQDKLYEYLIGNFEGKALVEKTMEGITLKEMGGASAYSLQDLIAPADDLIVDPMPNLYFTRDPFASVGTGVFLHKMRFPTRCRETIYADYIFRFHPDFEGLVKRYYDRDGHANIEGGDVLNLTEASPSAPPRTPSRKRPAISSPIPKRRSAPCSRSISRAAARSCISTPCSPRSTTTSTRSIRRSSGLSPFTRSPRA